MTVTAGGAIIKDMKRKAYGFTIVELLIVIVVIGILAAVSIVAYNGVNNRARVASASSALNQARKKLDLYNVENGSYPADLSTAGIASSSGVAYGYSTTNSNANFCLTATVGDISYYLDNDTKATPTEGGCNGHTWPGGVVMTNLVTNGDFSNGTSGWMSHNSTVAISEDGVVDTIVDSPVYANGFIYRSDFLVAANHVHYYAASVKVQNTQSSYLVLSLQDDHIDQKNSPVSGQWYNLSGTKKHTVDRQIMAFRIRHFYVDKLTASGKTMYIKNALAIDLTATFGAGKEPTKAQMDQIMNQFPNKWFNGTVTANTRGIL